jgi:CubicO group peptidase (beta-lactamase class C family)
LPAPEQRFRRLLVEAQSQGRLPSAVAAVFSGGELAWSDAAGLADVEQRVEATTDTQYPVASITKTFTAASIMRLRDEGKLDLDDPLSRHLPEAAHGTLTLRRMLAHAAGTTRISPTPCSATSSRASRAAATTTTCARRSSSRSGSGARLGA